MGRKMNREKKIRNIFLSSRFSLNFNQSSGVSSLIWEAVNCSRRHVSALLKEQREVVSHGLSSDMKEIKVAVTNSDHLLTSPIVFFSVLHTTSTRKNVG